MNLYLISQDANHDYDTYDSGVVAAESEEDARSIFPHRHFDVYWKEGEWMWLLEDGTESEFGSYSWAPRPEDVKVLLIGQAVEGTKRGTICASFNAG